MDEINKFLAQVINDPLLHAQWLNSLSYLEYRGARKILRTLATEDIDDEILNHTMEEVRHALYFKRLAMKMGGKKFHRYSSATLLAAPAIKNYFYELDRMAENLSARSGSKLEIYRLVTWLIEERALYVYLRYEAFLEMNDSKITLKPILADETRHLVEVKNQLKSLLRSQGIPIESLIEKEHELFAELLFFLQAALEKQANCEAQ